MREVVIVSAVRTPVGKAYKGTLRATRPDDLAAVAIKGALERVPQLDPKEIEDVILGCAMPEAEQGMNVARIASLRAGLPVEISAMTINRFCSSGLQAIAMAAERIMAGGAETIVAGGVESMTMIPMGGHKVSANPWLVSNYPDAYLSMGLTAERLAKRYNITREQADEFSVEQPQEGDRGDPGRQVRRRDRSRAGQLHHSERQQAEAHRHRLQDGRRSARRHLAGSAARSQAGVPCEGHGHGRQFVADVRRRGRRGRDVGRAREGAGIEAAGALRGFCDGRLQAGGDGRRPGVTRFRRR